MKGNILGFRYKILEHLAEGGFSKTYLAEDTQLPGKDICVVKQLNPQSPDENFLAVARRLFNTEANALHNLGHHPQIPQLLAYFEEAGKFYLVQQYIPGKTLASELAPDKIWSETKTIDFLQDGLNILNFVHERGVIHRDVKPDNLIRRHDDGKIVLVDFGTVKKVLQEHHTNFGQLTVAVGTQGYMPTEQARGKPRPASDLYALGIIAIQALIGVEPLELPEDDEGELIWQHHANVSRDLAKILNRLTRYHFKDRYKSAAEVLEDLYKLPGIGVDLPTVQTWHESTEPQDRIEPGKLPFSNLDRDLTQTRNKSDRPMVDRDGGTSAEEKAAPGKVINFQDIVPVPDRHKPRNPPQKNPKNNQNKIAIAIIVAIVAIALGGIGIYVLQQPKLQPEIDNSSDRSTERMEQGEGFRPELR